MGVKDTTYGLLQYPAASPIFIRRRRKMVQQKKKSLRPSLKPRRSGKEGKLSSDTSVKKARSSKARPSTVAKPSGKGDTARQRPALHVGDKIPSDALEAKVTADDGKKTSLGEQLGKSRPGGLIVFVYPKADDDGESTTRDSILFLSCTFSIVSSLIIPPTYDLSDADAKSLC